MSQAVCGRFPASLSTTLVVLGLPLLAACADGVGPDGEPGLRREILEQRALWESRSFRDYSYRLHRSCFCPSDARGPVRVEVRRGAVSRVAYVETGESVPDDLAHLFPSVSGLFVILLDAVERNAAQVDVEWDPELGYPTDFFIDYDRQVADEELGFEAGDVVPLAGDAR